MYYVKCMTRSSGGSAKGTPAQAIAYITDGHDLDRDPGYSDAELAYIARLGEGWKTDLEGGRVPLVGFGALDGVTDQDELASRFEGACQPWHDRRGTTGYKSFTLTLPKELSLFAEGHREEAKQAMYAAIGKTLAATFPDTEVTAVAAIHIRNEAGEVHYHAHVLVAKFARNRESGKMCSLNSRRGGNSPARTRILKQAWKASVDTEMEARLGVRVEQRRAYCRPTLVLPDGTRVPPLNRESRRLLDKYLEPVYSDTLESGAAVRKFLSLCEMDDRIFEVAAGKDRPGWNPEAFLTLFPAERARLGRHEKRVRTLERAGYLTKDGQITPAFKRHFAARHGIDTPELQRIRTDLARQAAAESLLRKRPVPVPDLWEAVTRFESIRARVERLGIPVEELRRIDAEARRRKPTPETLRRLRLQAQREPLDRTPPLGTTKTIVRAYLDLQATRLRAVFVIPASIVTFNFRQKSAELARQLKKARVDLFYAKERRIAEVGRLFRPMFWAARLILPRATRRMEVALRRCAGLAVSQAALKTWRMSLTTEKEALRSRARRIEHPAQAKLRPDLERARARIPATPHRSASIVQLQAGCAVLRTLRPQIAAHLEPWRGREDELVAGVAAVAGGAHDALPPLLYRAAMRAGRVGYLLAREEISGPQIVIPPRFAPLVGDINRATVRLQALGLPAPFPRDVLLTVPPAELERAVGTLRKAGLLDDGPGWTLGAGRALEVARKVVMDLEKTTARKERDIAS